MTRSGACALILAAVVASHRSADAQLAAAAYSDVKGVIEELVTTEIARTAVSETICRAGYVPTTDGAIDPSVITVGGKSYRLELLYYFPKTLHQLFGRQFAGLKSSVRSEAADLAGYLFYEGLQKLTLGKAELDALAKSWNTQQQQLPPEQKQALITDLLGRAGDDDTQQNVLDTLGSISRVDSSVSQLVKQPASSEPVPTLQRGTAVEAERFLGLPSTANTKMGAGVLFGWGDNHRTCLDAVTARFDSGGVFAQRVSPLDAKCAQRATLGEDIECELALGVRAAVAGRTEQAGEHVEATARIVLGVALRAVAKKLDASISARFAGERALEALVGVAVQGPRSAAALELVARALAISEGIPAPQLDARVAELVEDLKALRGPLERFATQWAAIRRHGAVPNLATFVDVLLGSDGALTQVCNGSAERVCVRVAAIRSRLARGAAFWPVVQAAANQDLRELARTGIHAVFDAKFANESCATSHNCDLDLYKRFVEALALYAIDMADGSGATDETRGAFRSAALEVIRNIEPGGFDRKYPRFRGRWWGSFFTPDLALRASWNASYVSSDGSNFRYVVGAPLAHVRVPFVYTPRVYFYLHGSFVDPVAPLSELALRASTFDGKSINYTSDGALIWNIFAPRLELAFGLPTLSRHLLVTAGASLRVAVPYLRGTLATDPIHYEYRTWGESDADLGQHVELGLSLKYVL